MPPGPLGSVRPSTPGADLVQGDGAAVATLSDPTGRAGGGRRPLAAGQAGLRQAVVLVADGQAHVGGQVQLVQGQRALGQLEPDHRVAGGGGRVGRLVDVGRSRPGEVALGAHRRLPALGWMGDTVVRPARGGRPEGGGGAHDRPDVERRLHPVEQQREPPVGAPPPSRCRRLRSVRPGCAQAPPAGAGARRGAGSRLGTRAGGRPARRSATGQRVRAQVLVDDQPGLAVPASRASQSTAARAGPPCRCGSAGSTRCVERTSSGTRPRRRAGSPAHQRDVVEAGPRRRSPASGRPRAR